jgi:hypothetical protein
MRLRICDRLIARAMGCNASGPKVTMVISSHFIIGPFGLRADTLVSQHLESSRGKKTGIIIKVIFLFATKVIEK